jgi:hypothetical protein
MVARRGDVTHINADKCKSRAVPRGNALLGGMVTIELLREWTRTAMGQLRASLVAAVET